MKKYTFLLFTGILMNISLIICAQVNPGKVINVNIFGGSNPINSSAWNNWNLPANRISPALKFSDGTASATTITSSIALGITDNGTPYPTTMCPPEVGRYAMLSSTSAHTLTFSNLKTNGTKYDLEIYASRKNTGNITRFAVGGQTIDINTASNYANAAKFSIVQPNAAGQIIITITRTAGAYAYVNGLKLTEVDLNQAPVSNAGSNQIITLPANSVTLNGNGTDTDGSITAYQWKKISGPSAFLIVSASSAQTEIINLVQGIYEFELMVTDNLGASARDTVSVTVNPDPSVNQAPVTVAGANQTIFLPINSVTLFGSSSDADGIIISYQWIKISGPFSFNVTAPANAQTSVTDLVQGIYEFELTATDDDGAIGKDTVRVTVNAAPPNQPPTVNAGTNQLIVLPANSVSVNGTATDTDGSIISYQWNRVSGPAQFTIVSPNSLQTAITNLLQGVYEFELMATDDDGATGKDTVRITVNAAQYIIPVIDASNNQTIVSPASSGSVTSAYSITGASLKNVKWSKAKVPGQMSKKVVWLGSSTIAGTGATTEDSAVVWRVGNYYTKLGIMSSWLNLGVSGANVFEGMPTGYVKTGAQPSADITHNVTTALNQNADIVILGYPSNGYEGTLSITEILFAYRTIYNTVINAGKKCYIMTSQPRPAFGTVGRNLLKEIADSIILQYPNNYIQAYYNIVETGTHNLLYNSGDNIHLNNTGHRVLFNSVVARNIFESLAISASEITSPSQANTGFTNLSLGKHTFQVTVTDTHEQSATDTTSITVNPEPGITSNAGLDKNLSLPVTSVTLDGSASTGAVTYLWSQLTGPAVTAIVSPTAISTSVTGILLAGTYSFELAINGGAARDTVFVYVTPAGSDKVININIFGGANPYNNAQWNNWNEPANKTSPVLKYSDGINSGVTITTSIVLGVTDNGTPYPTTMCPPEVGRYAMLSSTTAHTLTFNNLKTDGTFYNLEIYATRRNTGNTTRFTVNGRIVDISTASNYTNAARFTSVQANASGQIVITITRAAGSYAYVNGLKLTELGIVYVTQ